MPFKRDHSRRLLTFAKAMRTGQTDAERKLWHLLRDRRLGGFKLRRQVPIMGYVVDFYCLEASLVVESDGGQHYDPEQEEYDRRRTHRLSESGIRVIRFPDDQVLKFPDAFREAIYKTLTENTENE